MFQGGSKGPPSHPYGWYTYTPWHTPYSSCDLLPLSNSVQHRGRAAPSRSAPADNAQTNNGNGKTDLHSFRSTPTGEHPIVLVVLPWENISPQSIPCPTTNRFWEVRETEPANYKIVPRGATSRLINLFLLLFKGIIRRSTSKLQDKFSRVCLCLPRLLSQTEWGITTDLFHLYLLNSSHTSPTQSGLHEGSNPEIQSRKANLQWNVFKIFTLYVSSHPFPSIIIPGEIISYFSIKKKRDQCWWSRE